MVCPEIIISIIQSCHCALTGWNRVVKIMLSCITMSIVITAVSCENCLQLPFTNRSRTSYIYVCILSHLLKEWTKLKRLEGASWPVERSGHAACCLNYGEEHPQLLVSGGVDENNVTLDDVWILDVKSGSWRPREVSGDLHLNA